MASRRSVDAPALFLKIAMVGLSRGGVRMPLSDERFVDVSGIRTRYFDKGNGESIVLLHAGYFGAQF